MIIFDSGVGGFSIARLLPRYYTYTYLADQAYMPYGALSPDALTTRLQAIASWVALQKPNLLVLACNTATVGGVELFRQILTCPVVAVEPVVKMARGKTLLLATSSTLASPRLKELISQSQSHIQTYTPPGLPQAIEAMDMQKTKQILSAVRDMANKGNFISLGLSCTHYPLVTKLIKRLMPGLTILDPSEAVVRQIRKLYRATTVSHQGMSTYLTTGDMLRFKQQIKAYLGRECEPTRITIP